MTVRVPVHPEILRSVPPRGYRDAYDAELDRFRTVVSNSGGDLYRSTGARVSKQFARAVIAAILKRRASYTEALHRPQVPQDGDLQRTEAPAGTDFVVDYLLDANGRRERPA